GNGEQGVAQRFQVQPPAIHAPEQCVLRVHALSLGILVTRLLVGAREHEEPVQLLDRPSLFHEAPRKIVEQLRMTRRLAAEPEVARGADQACAEVVEPDPVDHDARREWILLRGNRLGKLQPAASMLEGSALRARQESKKPARY